jgi:ferredoxin
MHQISVQIHDGVCCGFGNCAALCPEVFVLDYDSNRVQLVPGARLAAHAAQIALAASECPTQAIEFRQMGKTSEEARPSHA